MTFEFSITIKRKDGDQNYRFEDLSEEKIKDIRNKLNTQMAGSSNYFNLKEKTA